MNVPKEDYECKLFVQWLEQHNYLFTHVPNESPSRAWRVRNSRMGTRPGFPDFIVVTKRNSLVFIEMKRLRGGRTSAEQKSWISALNLAGTTAKVCHGHQAAIELVENEEKQQCHNSS